MQDLLGLGDSSKVKAVAGLAGGIGHRGAACGILVGGAMALSLASTRADEEQAEITARGCQYVRDFVSRFTSANGGAFCRDIARTDFDNDSEIRKYVLLRSRNCVKVASKAAASMVEIVSAPDKRPADSCYELNRQFADNDFNCAYSTLTQASELLSINPAFSPNMLIPLNGGIGYSGLTCGALIGGCLAIGLARGGDTSQGGMANTIRRLLMTLVQGASAFNRLDLSPANDALLRSAELFKWFQGRYGSDLCQKLTRTDFRDGQKARDYFEQGVSKCVEMAAETAEKAAQLAR